MWAIFEGKEQLRPTLENPSVPSVAWRKAMTIYWCMFAAAALAAVFPLRSTVDLQRLLLLLLGSFYVLLIGFRYQVGGDWANYLILFEQILDGSLFGGTSGDVGYVFLNLMMSKIGADIYGVNLICGAVFVSGVFALARKQPLPWLAIAVVVPYLMVVVAMGYTRQSAALGLVFWGFATLRDGKVFRYVLLIVFGALFHKSAILMLPFGFLASGKQTRLRSILLLGGASLLLGVVFLQSYYEALWDTYVNKEMISSGGPIRVAMNVAAAIAMFVFWKRWKVRFTDYRLWFWVAILSLVCLPLVVVASTAVDRMALYLAPLQVIVYSRIPTLIQSTMLRAVAVVTILAGYAAVLWVWLTHGAYAVYWIPYQNVLFL